MIDIFLGLGIVAILVGLMYQCTRNAERDFQEWFTLLLVEAENFSYTSEQIRDFQECDWIIHYYDGLSPLEALEKGNHES